MSQDIRSFFGGGGSARKITRDTKFSASASPSSEEAHERRKRRSKRGAPVIESDEEDHEQPKSKKTNQSQLSPQTSSIPGKIKKNYEKEPKLKTISSENFFGGRTPSRTFKPTKSSDNRKYSPQKKGTFSPVKEKTSSPVKKETSSKNFPIKKEANSKLSLASKLKKRADGDVGLTTEYPLQTSEDYIIPKLKAISRDVANSESSSRKCSSLDTTENGNTDLSPDEFSSIKSSPSDSCSSTSKKSPKKKDSVNASSPRRKSPRKASQNPDNDQTSGTPDKSVNMCNEKRITPEEHKLTSQKHKRDHLKEKAATPQSKTAKAADKHALTPEEIQQKKALNYRRFLERKNSQPINPGSLEVPQGSPNCLAGLTIVITGLLDNIGREEATELCKRLGAKVTSAVSRNTTYLVAGSDAGATKTEKAQKLGTKVINEEGLFELIRSKTVTSSDDVQMDDEEFSELSHPTPAPSEADEPSLVKDSSLTSLSASSCSQQDKILTSSQESLSVAPFVSDDRLWVDKYRPSSLKAVIGQQGDRSIANKLKKWLNNWHRFHSGANKVKVRACAPGFAADDGSNFKAALLSGPPGVGKSTIVALVCQELKLASVELNASDSRSKKLLEQYTDCLQTSTLSVGVNESRTTFSDRHVLIMDEVDGMAGNQDRGGVGAIIQLLRRSRVPIICMCNDRQHQKVRSLAQYCYDLRVQRPRVEQIRAAMMSVCFKEKLKVTREALDRLIVGSNQDVRQVLHLLSVLAADAGRQHAVSDSDGSSQSRAVKDTRLGVFDVVMKVFSATSRQTMSCDDKIRLFFNDYSLGPLFVQENYLLAVPSGRLSSPKLMKRVSDAADSLCDGDVVDNCVRSSQNWSLLPTYAVFNTLAPGELLAGHLSGRAEFPRWLGKNSSRNKSARQLQELHAHMCLRLSGDRRALLLDYGSVLRDHCITPLLSSVGRGGTEAKESITSGQSAAVDAAARLFSYDLTREDLDQLIELCTWSGRGGDPLAKVDTRTKSAFTRAVRGGQHNYPYSLASMLGTRASSNTSSLLLLPGDDEEAYHSDENEADGKLDNDSGDIAADKMIKVKTSRKPSKQTTAGSSKTKKPSKKAGKKI